MSKKIVFFHATKDKQFGGFEGQCLLYGSYIAENYDCDVFYVNYPHHKENEPYLNTKLNIIDITQCDFSQFEGATFVVAPNYLGFLLVYTKQLSDCKILVWFTHPANLDWLKGQFFKLDAKVDEICEVLEATNGACFMDSVNRLSASQISGVDMTGALVPVSIPLHDASTLPADVAPIIHEDRISIGWLGRLDADKINSVINLLNNIRYSHITMPIDFHVIGDGNARDKIKLSNYSPGVRFIFTSYLHSEERDQYLRDNVDLVIAMGVSSLDCAELGLPVAIPIVQPEYFNEDRFVFLFDTQGYSLGWTSEQLVELELVTYPIKDVIASVYDAEDPYQAKYELGHRCKQVCSDQYDVAKNTAILLEAIEHTKFYRSDLASIAVFKEQMRWFRRYGKLTGRNKYETFIRFNHRPRVFQYKKGIAKYKYLVREIKRTLDARSKKRRSLAARGRKIKSFETMQNRYEKVVESIKAKHADGTPIKVAFFLLFKDVFALRPLFDMMLDDPYFDPTIIVIPNVSRAMPYMLENYHAAHDTFSAIYPGRVKHGYDEKTNSAIELDDDYDLVCFSNPYDTLVPPRFGSGFLADEENGEFLSVYASYAFCALKFWDEAIGSDFYNRMWKVCLENEENYEYLKEHQLIRGRNGIVTGYLKMDALASVKSGNDKSGRKTVMICPHHTVPGVNKSLAVSNFLDYHELFLRLPEMYPDIDFIFRPHPMLFDNLVAAHVWTQSEIDEFLSKLLSHENVRYDQSSDYMQTFVDSDAMIHDCGSFIAEYLYTGHPCCYMVKDEESLNSTLLPFGQKCVEQYYHAENECDIIRFIDEVVVQEIDPKRDERLSFAETNLRVNYPRSTEFLLEYLKTTLCTVSTPSSNKSENKA